MLNFKLTQVSGFLLFRAFYKKLQNMELEIHAQKLNGLLIASSISPVDENRRYLESDITMKKLEVQSEKGGKR